jgi:hypothetical protein
LFNFFILHFIFKSASFDGQNDPVPVIHWMLLLRQFSELLLRLVTAAVAGLGTPTMVFSIDASKPATDMIRGVPMGDDSDMVSKIKVSSI